MTEFAGILGVNRLKNLKKDNQIRRQNAKIIDVYFKKNKFIDLVKPLKKSKPCYHK